MTVPGISNCVVAAAWLLCGCLIACDRSGSAISEETCRERAAGLGDWLSQLSQEGPGAWMMGQDVELVALTEAPSHHEPFVSFVLTDEGVAVFGEHYPLDMEEWSIPVEEDLRRVPALLFIDKDVPWSAVVRVADWVRDHGAQELDFMFEATGPGVEAPGPSWLREEAAKARQQPRQPRIGEGEPWAARVYKRCPGALEYDGPPTGSSEEYIRELATRLPPRLVECGCRVDFDAVKELYWGLLGRDTRPAVAGVRVSLDGDGEALALPVDLPWSEASDRLIAAARAGQPLALETEGE